MPIKSANCPSCGGPVEFRSGESPILICPFCRSTLLRSAEKIENLGKMADLLEDFSSIQLGTEGHYRKQHFTVIGRIQMKYASGVWNEWHILFDDAKTGWLSDANGDYTVSFAEASPINLPAFADLRPDQAINLSGQGFTVTNLEQATCVAGDGELPFQVGAGFPAPVVDLRFGSLFATLDYSDTPPLLFIGESVEREKLKLAHLRQNIPAGAAGPTETGLRAFDCLACGSPITLSSNAIQRVACASCGSLLDTGDQRLALIEKSHEGMRVMPRLPLGSKGKLEGVDYEVIGFMKRMTESNGVKYYWDEYLLFDPRGEFRWLTCSDGHWNFVRVLNKPPTAGGRETLLKGTNTFAINYEGEPYKHFQHYKGTVTHVLGEFYWQVSVGETADIQDYVAPPKMLTSEATPNEITWSQGVYIDRQVIIDTFKVKQQLLRPIGVYANQPNPRENDHKKLFPYFWKLLGAGFLLHLVLLMFSLGGTLDDQVFVYNGTDKTQTSKPFELKGDSSVLRVENSATFNNAWLGLDMTLVNETTGATWTTQREISYYSGTDSDGSWSEGSQSDDVVFADLPAGKYHLAIDGEPAPELNGSATARVHVEHSGALWSNFFILLLVLLIGPLWHGWKWHAFENKRWQESDHPPVSASSSDDDD